MSDTDDSNDASLFDRLAAWLRDPRMCWAYTFCALAFLYTAWGVHSQPDVYNRVLLSRAFAVGGGVLLSVRAWAGGLHRWLARVGERGVRRARAVKVDVVAGDVLTAGVIILVVGSATFGVASLTEPSAISNAGASHPIADGFEDGDATDWSGDGTFSAQQSVALNGSYSADLSGGDMYKNFTKQQIEQATFDIQFSNPATDVEYFYLQETTDASANKIRILINTNGDIRINGANQATVSADTHYRFQLTNINYTSETWDLLVTNMDTGTTVLDDTYNFQNSGDDVNRVTFDAGTANVYLDTIAVGDTALTHPDSSGSDPYTHTFVLDDNTGRFDDNPELAVDALDADSATISEEDWSHVATKAFNFENEASVDVDEDTLHRLTVRDGAATYQKIGFRPVDEPNPYNLTIGTATATPTPTPTGNASEFCTLTETTDGGLDVTCAFPDPVSSYDYAITGPNGSLYNGSLDFDEPTDYYQGAFSENFTDSNFTTGDTSLDDLEVTWDGTYENGTDFNGTTSLFGTGDGGGGFSFGGGPTGKSGGGGGLQQAGGVALLAGAAILGYRRFSDQPLTETATSAASGVVGRLRGGGRG